MLLRSDVTKARVNVYPNPMQQNLSVVLSMEPQNGKVHIVDLTGKPLREITINSLQTNIDVADLIPGAYLVRYSDDGLQQTFKVTKQ